MEGRINADAQMAVHLLGIHTAHAGTNDDIGLLGNHKLLQHGQSLLGLNGDIGRNDLGRGQHFPKQLHRARSSGRGEAVEIYDFHQTINYEL